MAALRTQIETERGTAVHRLGHRHVTARADTWRTFGTITMHADGSGTIAVTRDGRDLIRFAFGSENVTEAPE